jgi:hypothetical protein
MACQHAWVFGGMGSWNDVSFDAKPGEYERVSEQLHRALLQGILAGANASLRAP